MKTEKYEVTISYYGNGQKHFESWYTNEKFHQVGGPAVQTWYENGQKCSEGWWANGKRHRIDDPALQYWFRDGSVDFKEYWINGNFCSEEEFKIKTNPEYAKYLELKSKFEGSSK